MHPPGITGEEEEEATKRRRNRLQNVTIFAIPFRIPLDITLMRRFQVGSLTQPYNICILSSPTHPYLEQRKKCVFNKRKSRFAIVLDCDLERLRLARHKRIGLLVVPEATHESS